MQTTLLPVTVVIPVKNEELNLPLCLARLARFAKVVVVDSGSTDRTREIALAHGCEFVEFRWDGHFPKKRNWLLMNQPPKTPWVFFLDADEYLCEEFVNELEAAIATTKHVGFRVVYSNYFYDKKLKYGVPQIKLPIFKVGSGLYERIDEQHWSGLDMEIHEHPLLVGSIGQLKTKIDHQDFKGLEASIARHEQYSTWEARRYLRLQQTGETWIRFTGAQRRKYRAVTKWWLAPGYFFYSWIWKFGILDGWSGFEVARLKAGYFAQIRSKIIAFSKDLSQPSHR